MNRAPLLLLAGLLLAGCTSLPRPAPGPTPETVLKAPAPDAVVSEAWISEPLPQAELDSLAVWPTEDGGAWVIVTAKASNQLIVFDADSGKRLRTVGGPGAGPGQFGRPNGIAVWGDTVFVAERDNHRVQALSLPDFKTRGFIGTDTLKVPYGLWLRETAPDLLELLVTDSFMADFRTGQLPPREQMDQRVRRFEVDLQPDGGLQVRAAGSFGDTGQAGMLRMVESIAGDPAHDRLLIADEDRRVGSTFRDYTLEGRFRGASLPVFLADAEGIALWDCDLDDGWWIAADQLTPTLFRVYRRDTLAPVGTFTGKVVAQTDGEALYAAGTTRFPDGALFVQHDNQAIAAFDLRDIGRALRLRGSCLP
ncbi:phytase [Pseudoxanthomonas winnipegensis]|jgi:3-phytase|uniref:Phytase n=1 Tax=Pseudoxanthomonas winnipegensis TaxID=2480810 RepID=A0ABY1WDJ4_9GAMM|nr:phytase [Pseudoxanthomonas winnipegensis]TAA12216.1 phytase [Pseudoxanthomonas winnipegensis]TAA19419.1 phytase [Pseudoxanthomonas winnipegensis]TAH70252.1 phytase [Pseudoxanthomonas winnipegensis]